MLTITEQPGEMDLFGINPRTLRVFSDAPASSANLRIEVTLQRLGAAGYQDIPGAVMSSPVFNFYASFNLSKRLPFLYNLPYVSNEFYSQVANEMGYGWKAIIREMHGTPPTVQSEVEITGCAIYGGVGHVEARTYDFFTDYSQRRAFLTNQPKRKLVDKAQPEWLYYPILTDENENSFLRATLYFSDGSTNVENLGTVFGEKGKVYIVPTGFNQLNLAQFETASRYILAYDLRLYHDIGLDVGAEEFSETHSYTVDFDVQSWPKRYYLFRNRKGGMDTVCARGKREDSHSAKMRSRSNYYESPTASAHYQSNLNTTTQRKVKQNVGFVNADERVWLEELLGASLAWEIVGSDFVPIRITSTSADAHVDDVTLQDFSFDFEYTENENI